jgi:serine protease Do
MMFWQSIQGSQSADAYRAYLKQYPSGIFASLAELKVKELAPPQVASRTPAARAAPTPSPPKKPYPPNARRWLGVQIQQVKNEIAKSLGMPSARGAFIVKALAGSPADKGDMKAEDIILNVGKTNILQFSDVPKAAASHSPGEKVVIGRWRISDRGIHYWEITLGMLDPKKHFAPNVPILDGLGFAIVHSVKGVEIVKVKPNSLAAQKIFQEGDIIVEVNQHAVNSVGEFNDRIAEATKKEAKKTLISFAEKR